MDLLDRYLAAIARELPKSEAADISAELRDTLMSRIEEKEAAPGCPLTPKEMEALLIDFGHPLAVAGRYRKVQHLIGPDVFPFWWATIRRAAAIGAGIFLVVGIIRFATGLAPAETVISQTLASVWPTAMFLFGGITLVFAVIERAGKKSRLGCNWKPAQLPAPHAQHRKRFEVATEAFMSLIFIGWWIGLYRFSDFLPFTNDFHIHLAPVWAAFYWPILAYSVFDMCVNLLDLARPDLVRLQAGLNLIARIAGVAIAVSLLHAGHWIDVSAPLTLHQGPFGMQSGFDFGMRIALVITVITMSIKAVVCLWRLIRPARPASRGNGSPQAARAA